MGSPPTCRPECITSTDCNPNEACINQKCRNPCVGTCGIRAICQVVNHNPICSCPTSLSGDPFIRCLPRRKLFTFFFILFYYQLNQEHEEKEKIIQMLNFS